MTPEDENLTDTPQETGPSEDAPPVEVADDDSPIFDGDLQDYEEEEPPEGEEEPEEDDVDSSEAVG